METVTISKEYYENLTRNIIWIRTLEAAGLDNWEGFEIAEDKLEANLERYFSKIYKDNIVEI